MEHKHDEDLRELFERFLGREEADAAVEDVRRAEQILHEHPAPQPDPELLADIKASIAAIALHRQTRSHRVAYRAAVVAAAVMVLVGVGTKLWEKHDGRTRPVVHASLVPSWIWESSDITTDDPALAFFTVEIAQIEEQMRALQSDGNGGNGDSAVEEIEMELTEIAGDFWKGQTR